MLGAGGKTVMTYAVSPALQEAVFGALSADATLAAIVGTDVFDAPPSGELPGIYVLLGEEAVRDRSSKTSRAASHDFVVSVYSDTSGFLAGKSAASAVCDVLLDAPLMLSRGNLTGLRFLSARAARGRSPERRRIDLKFRAFVEDT
jgi:uncharacterized protein DUF3168